MAVYSEWGEILNTQWSSAISITDPRLANLDKYKNLACAIVKVAADDYVSAVRQKKANEAKRIERFFRSDEFLLFTSGKIDPEYIAKFLRNMARHGKGGINIWVH